MQTGSTKFRILCASGLSLLLMLGAGALACEHDAAPMAQAQSIEGLGTLSFPTSTRSSEAQQAFRRGMLLLHLYDYPAAAEAFQQAQKLDPGFVMAYWGEAMTATWPIWNRDYPARGREALAKLGPTPEARRAKAGTAREKDWLDAVEKYFGPGTLQERDSAFLHAMETLASRYPDDDEAQLFHAQALLGVTRGERNLPNYLKAANIAKRVLARNPRHPGAAHYWIHGMDDPAHAAGALEAARVLSKIAPNAGHAQHMVSHIYIALGDWEQVAVANQRARDVANDASRRNGKPIVTCFHGNEWLQYAYYQLGRHRDAQNMLDECASQGDQASHWYREHPDQAAGFTPTPEAFERRLAGSLAAMRVVALIEDAQARDRNARLQVQTAGIGRLAAWDAFARGWAAAERKDQTMARAELAHLRAIARETPLGEEIDHMDDYLAVLDALLESAILAGEGQRDAAIALALEAAARNDAIPFDFGPPITAKPPHEFAGELLLQAGRDHEALAEFDRALKGAPRRALSMLGRARALRAAGKASGAVRAYSELAEIWQNADTDLAPLAEVKKGAGAVAAAR